MQNLAIQFSVAILSTAFGSLMIAAPVQAATVSRTFYQNGGSACTGALPTYEGSLRKRPRAIANEGTTNAFVTCSAVANDQNLAKPSRVFAYFRNRTTTAVDVTCTFVNGDDFYDSIATVQTVNLPVETLTPMFFDPVSPATTFPKSAVSVSCNLPAGVELNIFGHIIAEDIGA